MAQYIDKAAVIAEIVGYISNYKEIVVKTDRNDSTWVDSVSMIDAKIDVLQHLLSFLDTLEVKEVDLEKEIKEEYLKRRRYGGRDNMLVILNELQFNDIARHFFELGLNARKGE